MYLCNNLCISLYDVVHTCGIVCIHRINDTHTIRMFVYSI